MKARVLRYFFAVITLGAGGHFLGVTPPASTPFQCKIISTAIANQISPDDSIGPCTDSRTGKTIDQQGNESGQPCVLGDTCQH